MAFVVAIDGPTSSGKSTISNLIAKEMGFVYIQTGAMFRCVALELLRNGIELSDERQIGEILDKTDISFLNKEGSQIVIMNGEDVTDEIRTKEVTDYTSGVASISKVRQELLKKQREIAKNKNVVIEGRDTGTTVFPNADIKIFLTAKPMIRAKRKQRELEMLGEKIDITTVLESIYKWDEDAVKRKEGALKKAKDSISIDTTDMEIEELKVKMLGIIKERYHAKDDYGIGD